MSEKIKQTIVPKLEDILASKASLDDSTIEKIKEASAPDKEIVATKTKKEVEVPVVEDTIEKVDKTSSSTPYYEKAKELIALDLLEDFELQLGDDEEDTILVSEYTTMDEATFKDIVEAYKNNKKEEIKTKYISKEGLGEYQQKVVEILKNGGSLKDLGEDEDEIMKLPFEDVDLTNPQEVGRVLYTDYVNSKNLTQEEAISLIKLDVEKGVAEEKAEKVVKLYQDVRKKQIEAKLEEVKRDKESKEFTFKENKKILKTKLKEFGVKDGPAAKILQEYTKRDSNGEYSLVGKLKEMLNHPEDNIELLIHLADKKIFKDIYKIKSSKKESKTIIIKARGANRRGSKEQKKSEEGLDFLTSYQNINSK